jgi:hypothetical protein
MNKMNILILVLNNCKGVVSVDSEPLPDNLTRKQNNPVREAMFITVSSLIG